MKATHDSPALSDLAREVLIRLRQWSHANRRHYLISDFHEAMSFQGVPSRETFNVTITELVASGKVESDGHYIQLSTRQTN